MHEELVYGTPSTYRASEVRWAIGAALAAGIVWGLLSVGSGWRLVWLAPLIGAALGWVWRPAAYEPTQKTATWAVALMLLAALLSWATAATIGGRYISGRELTRDPGLVHTATHYWMFTHDQFPKPVLPSDDNAGFEESTEVEEVILPIRTDLLVQQRIAEMDTAAKREVVAWYLAQPGGDAARQSATRHGWRLMDLAWITIACWLALRIASSGIVEEDDDF